MRWGTQYLPVSGEQNDANSEAMELGNAKPVEPNEAARETSQTSGPGFELVPQTEEECAEKAIETTTGLGNSAAGGFQDPPQRNPLSDPVWLCVFANIAVLLINVVFTIFAAAWAASKHGGVSFGSNILYEGSCTKAKDMKLGIHLMINILSVALTATSSFCCNILMSPSREDIDLAHSQGNWLTIGVFSWRNFKNLRWPHRMMWAALTGTSLIVQLIYNSVVYTSINANTYAALVASHDFVSNTSIPNSAFEAQSCYHESDLAWNITDLRSSILNGEFEVLDPQSCIEAYSVEYLSDRRTVVAVPSDSMTANSTRLYISGYGYPARIPEAIPSNVIQNSELLGQSYYENTKSEYRYSTGDAFSWICASSDNYESCTKQTALNMSPWTLVGQTWAPFISIQQGNKSTLTWETVAWENDVTLESDWSGLNGTERQELKTEIEANPTLEQLNSFISDYDWSSPNFPSSLNVSSYCSNDSWTPAWYFMYGAPDRQMSYPIDHCLSQKTGGQCRLLYHIPIAVVMILCILLKLACLWCLVNVDRRKLFLTVGDAISSYLQNPDPLTKGWCMLSKSTVKQSKELPWNGSSDDTEVGDMPFPLPSHPEKPSTRVRQWSKALDPLVGLGILVVLAIYIAVTQILPMYARASVLGESLGEISTSEVWKITGFGSVQSDALLTNLATTYVGMELLANTPQLLVSFLYFLFNDNLTRMLHTADYNNYGVSRRPLRVSFPQGSQRSTFYLSIPYRYCLPLLLAFTLIHWLIAEGIFFVQIIPYDLAGKAMSSSMLTTCGVSTIPLEVAMFLTIAILLIMWIITARKYRCREMPFAIGCSLAISAACHPPENDLDAAFKPVMWGAVDDQSSDDEVGHCCFTSLQVTAPKPEQLYS